MSQAGRAWTVVVLLTGVGAFFYAFTLFMSLLAEGSLAERRNHKRLARMIDNLTDHFILCGFGRMGEIIAREFARQGVTFVVVGIRRADGKMDFNPEPETAIRGGDDLVVLGRGGSLKALETAAATA